MKLEPFPIPQGAVRILKPQPQPSFTVVKPTRQWEQGWADYMQGLNIMLTLANVTPASNAGAAAAGVAIGGLYTDSTVNPAVVYVRTQ